MTLDSFIHRLKQIKEAIPHGIEAHRMMSPKERMRFLYVEDFEDLHPKESAVMMLLYPKDDQMKLLLIERAVYAGVHSGQIGFPGGKVDKTDPDLEYTALRELYEEVGIDANDIKVVKPYSKIYIPPSNFYVQPFLGIATKEINFLPNPDEVASIIELPIEVVFEDRFVEDVTLKTSYSTQTQVPAFRYKNYVIWGATAMMISELKETLRSSFIY